MSTLSWLFQTARAADVKTNAANSGFWHSMGQERIVSNVFMAACLSMCLCMMVLLAGLWFSLSPAPAIKGLWKVSNNGCLNILGDIVWLCLGLLVPVLMMTPTRAWSEMSRACNTSGPVSMHVVGVTIGRIHLSICVYTVYARK